MPDSKTKVTLVGTVLAKQGVEFIYEGEVAECDTCKVKKACNNLQKGRKYRIVSVRTTHHECAVHLQRRNRCRSDGGTDHAPDQPGYGDRQLQDQAGDSPATRATAGVFPSAAPTGL